MYSPKISEDLVAQLYRLAKDRRMPMTRLIDGIIRRALSANDLPGGKSETGVLSVSFPAESQPRNAVA